MDLRISLRPSCPAVKRSSLVGQLRRIRNHSVSWTTLGPMRKVGAMGMKAWREGKIPLARIFAAAAQRLSRATTWPSARAPSSNYAQDAARRTSPRADASCMFAMRPPWEGRSVCSNTGLRPARVPVGIRRLSLRARANRASSLASDRKISRR